MNLGLLVDAAEFVDALALDVARAQDTAFVQAMTFEGDAAGMAVADLIQACPAPDRRVLVDGFTRHVLSDRLRWLPRNLVSPGMWREARATQRMLAGLHEQGVGVRIVNPAGPFFSRFPARNHKKLVALDGRVAYLGGINFSDHNFAWHDLMIRIEDEHVTGFLEQDFMATWEGRDRAGSLRLTDLAIHALDGRQNEAVFDEVLDLVAQAREEVFLECPYVTDPFLRELQRAARRGVRVRVVIPETHNFPLVRQALAQAAERSPLELRLYPGRMTHMKALLVDDRCLILGSANFDVWSDRSQHEYIVVASEPRTIAEFRRRVVEPDLTRSRPCPRAYASEGSRGLEVRLAGLAVLAALGARARGGSSIRVPRPGVLQLASPPPAPRN
jgi:cardiolipin synthase